MRAACHARPRTLVLLVSFALPAILVYWVVAASPPAPRQEEMALDGRPVIVDYSASASAEDLMLPFYPEAELVSSFSYTVKTKAGIPVTYYGSAVLHSADAPDEVVENYRAELPGSPEPEAIEDESGERHVLAVAGGNEVRKVTITGQDTGCRIELTRATRPMVPRPAPRPRTPYETPA